MMLSFRSYSHNEAVGSIFALGEKIAQCILRFS